jgi:hypothetical protein
VDLRPLWIEFWKYYRPSICPGLTFVHFKR